MNSWKSTLLSAWAPPLSTFIIGTGSTCASAPPRWRHSGWPASAAAALATASETPSIALAPRRPLLSVPSRSIIARSRPAWSEAWRPVISGGDLAVDVLHRLRHALAAPGVAAVAQLDGLELAGGGAGGHGRAAEGARAQRGVHLDGGVAAAVEHLAGVEGGDLAHVEPGWYQPGGDRRRLAAPARGPRRRRRRPPPPAAGPRRAARTSRPSPPRARTGRRWRPAAASWSRTAARAGSRAGRRTPLPRARPRA